MRISACVGVWALVGATSLIGAGCAAPGADPAAERRATPATPFVRALDRTELTRVRAELTRALGLVRSAQAMSPGRTNAATLVARMRAQGPGIALVAGERAPRPGQVAVAAVGERIALTALTRQRIRMQIIIDPAGVTRTPAAAWE